MKENRTMTSSRILENLKLTLYPILLILLITNNSNCFYYQNFNDRIFEHGTFNILTSVSNSNSLSDYQFKFYSHRSIPRDCSIHIDFPRSFYEAGLGLTNKSDISISFDLSNLVYHENFGEFRYESPTQSSTMTGICFT
jgi:hypothetical protein